MHELSSLKVETKEEQRRLHTVEELRLDKKPYTSKAVKNTEARASCSASSILAVPLASE
jgi:hypothetical protein